ncbi:hypothetical protein SAY86_022887 [Trapa natans]|uniref:UspA domain-containing protein n=1 Tax=Trapa natans TaxID=22666 RepID=A0AAN7R7E7_TRANT|nr:hypothetical protein SAY86_022887 [Trapa natans]
MEENVAQGTHHETGEIRLAMETLKEDYRCKGSDHLRAESDADAESRCGGFSGHHEGEAGHVICRKAKRIKPAAVVMGTRDRSLIQGVLQGSVSVLCSVPFSSAFLHCKAAPVVTVPGKEAGDQSLV